MSPAVAGPLVVLVGPPGAGKSAVGAVLAARHGVPLRDTDADVEAALGKPIAEVFIDDGEPVFRAAERAAVAAALVEHTGVLALGGGAVADPTTREALAGHVVAFLDVSLSAAVARVGLARDRPLLLGSPRSQLKSLMEHRRGWYEQVCTMQVDTTDRTVEQVADDVSRLLAEAS